jgi:hypothetical protein
MARGKTHKRGKSRKSVKSHSKTPTMTIPGLRKSLDHISSYGESLAKSGAKTVKDAPAAFASEWKKVFGKPLSMDVAEKYIRHLTSKKGKLGKKTRKIRGGALGAPLDALTRPGLELPYGNFLPYVKAGFWNPEPAISADYGRIQGPLPYPETGSNRMSGGGFLDSISNGIDAISFRPFAAQNPSSMQQDATTAWKGQPLGPGGESYARAYQYQMPPNASVPVIANPVYTRTLANDVSSR